MATGVPSIRPSSVAARRVRDPAIASEYPDSPYKVRQAVGVDTSSLFAARTGIRGSNDLVWVGRAANYAAKLCSLRHGAYASWITEDVYKKLIKEVKFTRDRPMWERCDWTARDMTVYRSTWTWAP